MYKFIFLVIIASIYSCQNATTGDSLEDRAEEQKALKLEDLIDTSDITIQHLPIEKNILFLEERGPSPDLELTYYEYAVGSLDFYFYSTSILELLKRTDGNEDADLYEDYEKYKLEGKFLSHLKIGNDFLWLDSILNEFNLEKIGFNWETTEKLTFIKGQNQLCLYFTIYLICSQCSEFLFYSFFIDINSTPQIYLVPEGFLGVDFIGDFDKDSQLDFLVEDNDTIKVSTFNNRFKAKEGIYLILDKNDPDKIDMAKSSWFK